MQGQQQGTDRLGAGFDARRHEEAVVMGQPLHANRALVGAGAQRCRFGRRGLIHGGPTGGEPHEHGQQSPPGAGGIHQ